MDLLALLPFQFIQMHRHRERLFYLVKVVRLFKAMAMLDTKKLIIAVKKKFMDHLEQRCHDDPEYANSMFAENYIAIALNITFIIKIALLSLVIMNISYVCGMMWLIMCQCVEDFIHGVDYTTLQG